MNTTLVYNRIAAALPVVLWLAFMSAVVVESDVYRYAAIALTIIAAVTCQVDCRRVMRDWLAVLCVAWAAYALIRFLFEYIAFGEHGASEWLYVFPAFFPILGVALTATWKSVERALFALFAIAALLFVILTPYRSIAAGDQISPLLHHNSIHGAVGCGFLFLGVFHFMAHQIEVGAARRARNVAIALALVIMAFALVNIYGAKSKGVWLAMLPALATMVICAFVYIRQTHVRTAMVALLGIVVAGSYLVRANVEKVALATFNSVAGIGTRLYDGDSLIAVMKDAIASNGTPTSLDERLQLWTNALEVLQVHPVLGSGNGWLTIWHTTDYAGVPYTLIHNGYLEILVRYGFVGLGSFVLILAATIHRLHRAALAGVISKSAFSCYLTFVIYFCFTILSNSNNRLAIGESFVLLCGALTFACTLRMRDRARDVKLATATGLEDGMIGQGGSHRG